MQKMIAIRDFQYRGIGVKLGDELDVDEEHVALFTKIGHARLKEQSDMGYQTRMLVANTSVKRKSK
jgi:hypothetical protein